MDRFVDDGSLEDNVDSFLSPEAADPMDRVGRSSDASKGMMDSGCYIGGYFCLSDYVILWFV